MNDPRERLEEFARRHGFSSFQEMKLDLLRKKQSQIGGGEQGEEVESLPIPDDAEEYGHFAPDEELDAEAGREIMRQVEGLLERFPDIDRFEEIRRDGLAAVARVKGGAETLELWRRVRPVGLSLADAFLLVNLEDILAGQREAAWQAAVSSLAGRAHLLPSAGGAMEETPVPGNVFELYRALNPGASEGDIRAHYRRSKQKR